MKKPLVIGVIALLTSGFFTSPAQAVAVLASNSDASGLARKKLIVQLA